MCGVCARGVVCVCACVRCVIPKVSFAHVVLLLLLLLSNTPCLLYNKLRIIVMVTYRGPSLSHIGMCIEVEWVLKMGVAKYSRVSQNLCVTL